MQCAVPLTRSLPPHDGEEMVLEFELSALPDDIDPSIFVGVLLTGSDTDAMADVAEHLVHADVEPPES